MRPSLLGLLGVAALLYLWDLGASGWANAFYSAAVQAGSTSWKAFFFGSFDASNFITVDKSPAALWVMDLSARLFGVNAWSILVPQALEGVATVGFTYLTVRRWFSPAAGLIAGATVALTPVAALMFRFDNPDALLVLLLTVATYATVRAIEAGKTKWLVLAATLVGIRVSDQDAPGVPGGARVRTRLPRGGAGVAATADRATRDCGCHDGRRIGMVGRDRAAHARRGPTVHRRVAEQQHPQSDLRLQRIRHA